MKTERKYYGQVGAFTIYIDQTLPKGTMITEGECLILPNDQAAATLVREFRQQFQEIGYEMRTKKRQYDQLAAIAADLMAKKEPENDFQRVAREIGELVTQKNKAYGDAFGKSGDFLKLLYPNGLKPEQYNDALSLVRMFDKMMRVATRKDAFGESPWRDMNGYTLLSVVRDELLKGGA